MAQKGHLVLDVYGEHVAKAGFYHSDFYADLSRKFTIIFQCRKSFWTPVSRQRLKDMTSYDQGSVTKIINLRELD